MPYERIDPAKIRVLPLSDRESQIDIERTAILPDSSPPDAGPLAGAVDTLVSEIRAAKETGASVVMTFGAHLIKNGCGLLLNQLIKDGWVTHLATQGAGVIHDWEFAFQGKSSESVRVNAPNGEFGTWAETGVAINLAAVVAAANNWGLGETLGRYISEGNINLRAGRPDPSGSRMDLYDFMLSHGISPHTFTTEHPFAKYSVAACAYEHKVPLCVMPGIGYDIYACHPMFTPTTAAALGRATAIDFHTFAAAMLKLTGGVYMSVGSAIMSPQVFEKAFSIANNLLKQQDHPLINDHHVTVCDIAPSGDWDWSADTEPPADHPAYYLRWCKSFARLTADTGSMQYVQLDNRILLHNLVAALSS